MMSRFVLLLVMSFLQGYRSVASRLSTNRTRVGSEQATSSSSSHLQETFEECMRIETGKFEALQQEAKKIAKFMLVGKAMGNPEVIVANAFSEARMGLVGSSPGGATMAQLLVLVGQELRNARMSFLDDTADAVDVRIALNSLTSGEIELVKFPAMFTSLAARYVSERWRDRQPQCAACLMMLLHHAEGGRVDAGARLNVFSELARSSSFPVVEQRAQDLQICGYSIEGEAWAVSEDDNRLWDRLGAFFSSQPKQVPKLDDIWAAVSHDFKQYAYGRYITVRKPAASVNSEMSAFETLPLIFGDIYVNMLDEFWRTRMLRSSADREGSFFTSRTGLSVVDEARGEISGSRDPRIGRVNLLNTMTRLQSDELIAHLVAEAHADGILVRWISAETEKETVSKWTVTGKLQGTLDYELQQELGPEVSQLFFVPEQALETYVIGLQADTRSTSGDGSTSSYYHEVAVQWGSYWGS